MGAMASGIISLTIVSTTVYSGADQRKHQSTVSLAFVRRIHQDRWMHKKPVTRKMSPFDDVIMLYDIYEICHYAIHSMSDAYSFGYYIDIHTYIHSLTSGVTIWLQMPLYTHTKMGGLFAFYKYILLKTYSCKNRNMHRQCIQYCNIAFNASIVFYETLNFIKRNEAFFVKHVSSSTVL